MKNINELLNHNAHTFPKKDCFVYCDDESRTSYYKFNIITNKVANYLLGFGLKKGDTISLILHNCPQFLEIIFGALKIGVRVNPININLVSEELKYLIDDANAKLVFVNYANYTKLQKIKFKKNISIVTIGFEENNCINYNQIKFESSDSVDRQVSSEDEALLIYSSGTTGKPKGVILTQGNMIAEGNSIARFLKLESNIVTMACLPFFFVGGLLPTLFSTMCVGGTVIYHEKFSKTKFWSRVSDHKINWSLLVPTMYSFLLNPPEDISKYDISSVKFFISSAAPLPVEVLNNFEQKFNIKIFETYGLTENSAWSTMNPLDNRKIGSVGVAMDIAKVMISNDGEVLLKGDNIMKGYNNMPELTSKTLKDGWLYTGDLGYLDDKGYLYIVDRKKDLIIRGGENISPKEIDNVLYTIDGVVDAATIGVADNNYGEEVVAYVVRKKKLVISEQIIIDECKKKLASHKCPKKVIFIDEIPKGPSGKLLRRKLQEDYKKRF